MRVGQHNARTGKRGTFSAKHNDRNFDITKAEHIDPSRSKDNYYWQIYENEKLTFEQAERRFYKEHFTSSLEAQNARYIADGHADRTHTMDEYRRNKNSCPEEAIITLGTKDDNINPELLKKIVLEQLAWEKERFPQAVYLDVAMHCDEQGAPHFHARRVWVSHKNGLETVGQKAALREMGIEPPHKDEPENNKNNRKMTYSLLCREHFIEVAKSYGLDIEEKARPKEQSGLDLAEYQLKQTEIKLTEAEQTLIEAKRELERTEGKILTAKQAKKAQLAEQGFFIRALNKILGTDYILTSQKEYSRVLNTAKAVDKVSEKEKRIKALKKDVEKETQALEGLVIDREREYFLAVKNTEDIDETFDRIEVEGILDNHSEEFIQRINRSFIEQNWTRYSRFVRDLEKEASDRMKQKNRDYKNVIDEAKRTISRARDDDFER